MSTLVKYECLTASSALDLVEHISNLGGIVCVIMRGNEPTSTVLSDFPFNKPEHMPKQYIRSMEAVDWDVNYFKEQMK